MLTGAQPLNQIANPDARELIRVGPLGQLIVTSRSGYLLIAIERHRPGIR